MAVSKSLRFEIFKRDKFTCQYCGRSTPAVILEVDHMIPKSQGGPDSEENLITSCYECNRGKGATPLETILKDRDIHEETIILAEREMQLREYNEVRKQIREREDSEIQILEDHFVEQFSDYQKSHARDAFPKGAVRAAMRVMSYLDILDFIPAAVGKTRDSDRGGYHNVRAAKYLAGILRKQREMRGDTTAIKKSAGREDESEG